MDFLITASISFFIAFLLLPVVINIFNSIDLLDIPDRRKIHKVSTPSLGGIPIVSAWLLSMLIILPFAEISLMKFFFAGIIITFILGIRDDLSSLYAGQKLIIQILAALLVVHFADLRLVSFHGFLGIGELDPLVSKLFSIFVIVALTNSYNLIDGIDGLAAGVAIIALLTIGFWFFRDDQVSFALMSISLASALMAFMYFNWYPSKIFMGDTGSLVIGFTLAGLMIRFINSGLAPDAVGGITSYVAIAIALLIVPIFDTLRVFVIRIFSGKSPFAPDKNHIHHLLLKLGFDHGQASMILIGYTVAMVLLTFASQSLGTNWVVLGQMLITLLCNVILDMTLARKIKQQWDNRSVEEGFIMSKSA
ncbi:MAG: MraY family glycosyltransferase [Bacteroidota bacterium]